jgi:serpin B
MIKSAVKSLVVTMAMWLMAAPAEPQTFRDAGLLEALRGETHQQAPEKFNQAMVKGNTEFALNLYGTLRGKEGNIFLSPYSVSSALAMTYLGARGETAKQMASVLRLPADQGEATRAFAGLNKSLNGEGATRYYQLDVANALWGAKGVGFLDAFLKPAHDAFGAGLQELDFEKDKEGSRQTINNWVEQKTQGKISNLFPPGSIDSSMRLVLTNAIYFKSAWLVPFYEQFTKQSDFSLANGQKVTVPLMQRTGMFPYFEESGLQGLELPYTGYELSMLILLPRQADGLPALEKSLTAERLSAIESNLSAGNVEVFLPKFKTTSEFELTAPFRKLGMELPFTDKADFSGMDGKRDLLISAIVHKAYVDVNEKGTEAAAATGVGMTTSAMPAPPREFRVDHPFLFLIRHRRSGTILFIGRVQNPLQ